MNLIKCLITGKSELADINYGFHPSCPSILLPGGGEPGLAGEAGVGPGADEAGGGPGAQLAGGHQARAGRLAASPSLLRTFLRQGRRDEQAVISIPTSQTTHAHS